MVFGSEGRIGFYFQCTWKCMRVTEFHLDADKKQVLKATFVLFMMVSFPGADRMVNLKMNLNCSQEGGVGPWQKGSMLIYLRKV